MNDRNPVTEAGQDLLDRVWDIEAYRDKVRTDLGVEDGEDFLGQLEAEAMRGNPERLREITDKVGGVGGLLAIVAEVVRLEEERNAAMDRYIEARREDELPSPTAIVSDEDQSSYKLGEVVGFSNVPMEDLTGFGGVDDGIRSNSRIERKITGQPIKDSPQA